MSAARGRSRPSRSAVVFRLRRARAEDIPVLTAHRAEMWRAIGHHSATEIRVHLAPYRRWLRPRLRSGEVVAFVATVGATPVGSGALWWMPQEPKPGALGGSVPYVMSMYTRPEQRRLGVATAIVRALVRVARHGGASRVVLHAAPQGKPLYERLGFEPTREMRLWIRRPTRAGPPPRRATRSGRGGSRR